MTPVASRRADRMTPALAVAVSLHLALLALLLWNPGVPPLGGSPVPITIVARAPTTDSRAAEEAPVTQTAQTPTPVPQAKAPAPPPPPPPPQRPQPVPKPEPKAIKAVTPKPVPAPTPARKTNTVQTHDTFSLDALAADVSRARRPTPQRPAFAAQGATRAETAPQARVDAGQGVSQSDIQGLSQLLNRLWNKSCNLDDTVIVPVSFTVGFDGRLVGTPNAGGREKSSDPAVSVAARRALDAVGQAAPYGPVYRGKAFKVIFDAKKACANG
jgi:type IV secretory pathway VirB10-like protein